MKKLILLITLFVGFFIQAQNYAIEQSGVITTYQDYPKTFTDSLGLTTLNYRTTSPTRKYDDGFRDVVKPTIDTQTQRQGAMYFDVANDVFTYFIDNLSPEEIQASLIAQNESLKQQLIQEKINAQVIEEAQTATDEEALDQIALYPYWSSEGVSYTIGFKVLDFTADSTLALYKTVQSHTSQVTWEPRNVPALFTRIQLDVVLDWVAPTGAQDAYNIGDQVIYPAGSGTIWESTVDANVFAPGVVAGQWTQL